MPAWQLGLRIDALDRSYQCWYSAEVVGLNPQNMKTLVKYDGFDDHWNDWVSFSERFRIAPHKSRCCNSNSNSNSIKTKEKEQAKNKANKVLGTHVFAATQYGKSDEAKLLRAKIADGKLDFDEVDVLMAGYMYKKGSWNNKWDLRYFTLRNDNRLYYSHSSNETFHYKAVIPLCSILRLTVTTDPQWEYVFTLETKPRVYYLACVSQSSRTDWMSAISCLMASPLQVERLLPLLAGTFQRAKEVHIQTTTKPNPTNTRKRRRTVDMSIHLSNETKNIDQ